MGKKTIDEQALLTAALEEFTARSYDSASVNTIISRAGISKGSFYYRFSDKYELYLFLIKTGINLKWEYIQNNRNPEISDTDDVFAQLTEQARAGVEFAVKNPEYYRLGRMFSREQGNPVYKKVMEDIEEAHDSGFGDLLRQMHKNGLFNRRYDPGFIERLVPFLLRSFDEAFPAADMENPGEVFRYFEEYVEFIKSGLSNK